MNKDLSKERCEPCEEGTGHLMVNEIKELWRQVPDWTWEDHHHLTREFKFNDFKQALAFVNEVGELAESEGHHPDIYFGWGYVKITLFTHKVDGLTENDFIMAAKIDRL
ncbi:MAG: 4a-hydroxytetrahydrobiopterin dehydratase [Parcubacteria group bacterium CG11_big_fil_rev_8_21_14_0_20_39_22]|nr:MAG: 4a-hydroxytetrahydrobiopterin dehydratase [Parcubacteria group bacterium CG11_big_fil_rev_8_21_14_0_20_39_22]